MPRFFSNTIVENKITLDKEESRHLSKVLRLKEGDKVEVIDGKSHLYQCRVSDAKSKNVLLQIENTISVKEHYYLSMGVAPTKNLNRWEWFMEKATEIGIDRITPLLCSNSERKLLRMERQEKILLSAAKQSLKLNIPQLEEMQDFKKFIQKEFNGDKFIAHCADDEEKSALQKLCKKQTDTLVLIGAEGDFSPEEIKLAKKHGFKAVSLGNSRLRTETAALVACHIVNLKNE